MKDKISCIYLIENIKNHKVYIGETSDFVKRHSDHMSQLKKKSHENPHINKDLQQYNISDFKFYIIEKLPNNKKLRLERETYWIQYYGGSNSGQIYNYKDSLEYSDELLIHMSEGRSNIPSWNKNIKNPLRQTNMLNTKYKDTDFINDLCAAYEELHSYSKVAEKFKMQKGTVHRLITNAMKFNSNVSTNPDECKGVK